MHHFIPQKAVQKRPLVAACAVIILTLAGCGGAPEPPAPQTQVHLAQQLLPASLEPAFAVSASDNRLLGALFEGLTALDPSAPGPQPGIAERWQTSPDGRIWTFHLRKCSWRNGEPVTAGDFVFAWRHLLEPQTNSPNAFMLFGVRGARAFHANAEKDFEAVGIKALDPHTLQVAFDQPEPGFASYAALPALAPVYHAAKAAARPAVPTAIVTNGPFRLAEFEPDHITLQKSENYWNRTAVKADRITITICDESEAWKAYTQGLMDALFELPPALMPEIARCSTCRSMPASGLGYVACNTAKPPFDDSRVRQAFDLATDRELLARYVLKGGQRAAERYLPPGMLAEAEFTSPSYDPERAAELLHQSGRLLQSGAKLRMICAETQRTVQVATALQKMWRDALGVQVDIVYVAWTPSSRAAFAQGYDLLLGTRRNEIADPALLLNYIADQNAASGTGSVPTSASLDVLEQAENALLEQKIVLPLYYPVANAAVSERIVGIIPDTLGYTPLKNLSVRKPTKKTAEKSSP